MPSSRGIFLTQESNTGLPHCRRILYCLSHQGSLRILEWVAYLFFRGSSQPKNRTRVSCTAGRFFTSWATKEAQLTLKLSLTWKQSKCPSMGDGTTKLWNIFTMRGQSAVSRNEVLLYGNSMDESPNITSSEGSQIQQTTYYNTVIPWVWNTNMYQPIYTARKQSRKQLGRRRQQNSWWMNNEVYCTAQGTVFNSLR